jgi:hypothetical protein
LHFIVSSWPIKSEVFLNQWVSEENCCLWSHEELMPLFPEGQWGTLLELERRNCTRQLPRFIPQWPDGWHALATGQCRYLGDRYSCRFESRVLVIVVISFHPFASNGHKLRDRFRWNWVWLFLFIFPWEMICHLSQSRSKLFKWDTGKDLREITCGLDWSGSR